MSFTWEIVSGKLYEDSGSLIAIGYSGGNKGENPGAVNNPEFVSVPDVGPIPTGTYRILPPENDPRTGEFSMSLEPDPGNVMHGRSGFRIHGDNPEVNRSASEGCIILPRTIREQVWNSGDRTLDVVSYLPDNFSQ